MKLHVYHHTIVLYIKYKFDRITSIGYLVMAEDGRTDGQRQTYIPPLMAGDNNNYINKILCWCIEQRNYLSGPPV